MKKIILDLETTNVSVFKAKILEICVLFVENNEVIEEYYRKIQFDKMYCNCDKNITNALNFNKIFSQEDLDNHNKNAISEKEMIEELVLKCNKFGKVVISGWNNATFDNIIIKRIFEESGYDFLEVFDYHSRDVYCMFLPFYEKFFKDKFHLSLQNAHQHLFPEKMGDKKFHSANYDCLATLDIDIWIEKYFEKLEK